MCTNTQVDQCLPNRARSLIPASERPRSPLEETQSTPTLAQTHTEKKQKKNRAPTPTELKTFIWQHQLTPDTHSPALTLQHFKTNQNCSWDQRCGYSGQRESFILCMCVCFSICVPVYGRDKSEIEGGEVRGGTHPLNPPLLTCEQRDGAERSTANWINWSITSHLSGGTKAPFKKKKKPTQQPNLNYAGGDHWSNRVELCQQARPVLSSIHDMCGTLLLNNTVGEG